MERIFTQDKSASDAPKCNSAQPTVLNADIAEPTEMDPPQIHKIHAEDGSHKRHVRASRYALYCGNADEYTDTTTVPQNMV